VKRKEAKAMNTQINLFHRNSGIAFKEGEIIFRQGDDGDSMYIIVEGEVDILYNGHHVDTLRVGQLFGEMALLRSVGRVASAAARTDCRLVPLDMRTFLHLIDHNRHFVLDVMRVLAERTALVK
jgi:CRP/FNR family transcriptional regulator, cyclic AMP receptor protein